MIKKTLCAVALAALFSPCLPVEAAQTGGQCRQMDLSPAPYWTFSGSWSADGSSLMLIDVVRKALVSYPVAGGEATAVLGEMDRLEASRDGQLSLLHPHGDGFLLEGRDGRLTELSANLNPLHDYGSLLADETVPGLRSLDSWHALDDDTVLLYGDYQHFTGRWLSVFARASLSEPGKVEVLKALPASSSVRRFYLNNQCYLTGAADKGYFLYLGQDAKTMSPEIWEIDPDGDARRSLRRLNLNLPTSLRSVKMHLPEPGGQDYVRTLFAAQAKAQSAVGLMGHGDLLYLLARQPTPGAGVHWTLTVIDPAVDRVLRTLHLPTRAPHVMLVPGDDQWALVEKQAVQGFGVQGIGNALLMPGEWFEAEDSPLLDFDARLCR